MEIRMVYKKVESKVVEAETEQTIVDTQIQGTKNKNATNRTQKTT